MPTKVTKARPVFARLVTLMLQIAVMSAVVSSLVDPQAQAQSGRDEPDAQATQDVHDRLGRLNPRTFQIGLFNAIAAEDYARLAEFLDAGETAPEEAISLARRFAVTLDRNGTLTSRLDLPLKPEGNLDDGLPEDEERLGELAIETGTVPILAHRVEREDEPAIWLISPTTLEALPELPEEAEAGNVDLDTQDAVEDDGPHGQHKTMLFGAPLQSWVYMIGVGLSLFFLVVILFRMICRRIGLQAGGDVEHHPFAELLFAAVPPIALMAVYSTMGWLAGPLGAGIVERTALGRYSGIVTWCAGAWLVWRLSGKIAELAAWRFRLAGHLQWIGFSNFAMRLLRVLLVALGVSLILETFGIDVTAGLAALGIGGLALALGARKAVEDMVGSVMILADKPFRIGDSCTIGDKSGTIIDIGMRSTRIRTFERTMLSIPNSHLADTEIENLGLADRFLMHQKFGIPFSAPPEYLDEVLRLTREILFADPAYIPNNSAVRFAGFAREWFEFEIRTFLHSPDWEDGFAAQERILLNLIRALHEHNIELAVPVIPLKR